MLQPFCERRFRYSGVTRKGEEGIYLPLLAGILVALFLVVGLLVDSANLYLKQERLQHSADLAVESGLGYRILQGWAYFHGYNAAQDPVQPNQRRCASCSSRTGLGTRSGACRDLTKHFGR